MKRSSQIIQKSFFVAPLIHVEERLAPGAICKGNVSSINANIVTVSLCFTCLKNKQHFSRSKVKGQCHRLTVWPWHLNGRNSVNLGIIKMNKNWKVKNSYGYVVTATKIRFQFQFTRSPDAVFGGHIIWLLNWKFKCGWGRISNIANYVKCNCF